MTPIASPLSLPSRLSQRYELSLYVVQTAPYASLAIRDTQYPHWILSHVRTGDVEIETRGERARAGAGDVMLHPPRIPFSEFAAGAGTHQWFGFDAALTAGQELFRVAPVCAVVSLPDPDAYAQTFDALETAWNAPPSLPRELQLTARAFDLFGMVLAGWQASGSPPRSANCQSEADRFQDVLAYMEAHLHEKLSRDDLARRVHLHPGYFDRLFRAAYGQPPMRVLRDLRLARARTLLERGTDTLDTVAQQCGWHDGAQFSRVFRQAMGQSPGQYRESAKTAQQSYIPPLPDTPPSE